MFVAILGWQESFIYYKEGLTLKSPKKFVMGVDK